MTTNPIAAAVEPQRAAAILRATDHASKMIESVYAELEAADWNINVVAPYPTGSCWAADYADKKAKYVFFSMFVTYTHGSEVVKKSEAMAARFVKEAAADASAQYDAFIAKLNAKIGEVTAATLTGDHVWGYSFLKVTKDDGTTETWKTQQIINVSKLNKLFNQYPTRKVKA